MIRTPRHCIKYARKRAFTDVQDYKGQRKPLFSHILNSKTFQYFVGKFYFKLISHLFLSKNCQISQVCRTKFAGVRHRIQAYITLKPPALFRIIRDLSKFQSFAVSEKIE